MTPSLRILVVLPMYGGSLPIARYCARALADMGHAVETFEAPGFHDAFTALKGLRVTSDRLEYLESSFVQLVSNAVLAKVETFEPDLVLALAQAPLTRQALKRLKRENVVTAMWFVEDFRLFTYWRAFAPYYDFFAVIQQEPFLSELAAIGQENALYLPLAALPEFHAPRALSVVEKKKYGSDLSFLGAGYPNRRVAFRKLTHLDFKIWGSDWDGDPELEKYVQLRGARVSSEDMVTIFNATRINLNLHSSVQARELVTGGDFVNPRTFELAGCGAFQLVDERTLMPELYAPDEMATFTSMDDLLDKIDHYLAHPEEREAVAHKARERTLKDHTYARRLQTLIDFIAARRPGWPEARTAHAVLPEDFPDDLKDDLAALLRDLGLPSGTAFADVVGALRQRHGALNDLETAILFLDEWRKQYARTT